MALMFQRLARNFVKNGYFPTDEETIARTLNAIAPVGGPIRIIDPCAGEGVALAECKHHLKELGCEVTALGVEYDAERAWHAKNILDRVIHGDFQDCVISRKSFGMLWLNPPYGDLVSDRAATGSGIEMEGKKRLEKLFYRQSINLLQPRGILVLIIPRYVLDAEFCGWIASHFECVRVFLAPEQRFKQVVVFGVRRRPGDRAATSAVRAFLESVADGEIDVIPPIWPFVPYVVPVRPQSEVVFTYSKIEAHQLADEVRRFPTLWDQFEGVFRRNRTIRRAPLRAMGDWHLALALAAGQISGAVRSQDGRIFVVKGDTYKDKVLQTMVETDGDEIREVRLTTDRFVPVIRAIDFTPSEKLGMIYTIS